MIKDKVTRRAALKLTGGLSVGGLIDALGKRQQPVPAALAMQPENVEVGPDQPYRETAVQLIARAIENDQFDRNMMRVDRLDPDVAALRSVSPAMKQRIMMVRSLSEQGVLDAIRKLAWD